MLLLCYTKPMGAGRGKVEGGRLIKGLVGGLIAIGQDPTGLGGRTLWKISVTINLHPHCRS